MSAEHTLTALVERIQDGDRATEAEALLYDIVSRAATIYLCRNGVRPGEASDLAHDTYIIVLAEVRRGGLRCADALVGFIRTVARRRLSRHIQAAIRSRSFEDVDNIELRATASDPEVSMVDLERRELAYRILARMRNIERELVCRFYLRGESESEIRADLSLSANTFRVQKSKAKTRLAALVAEATSPRRGAKKCAEKSRRSHTS